MYAIIRAGGKQAKVREGDVIDVERIKSDISEVTFTPLLLVDEDGSVVSDPEQLAKASVTAEIVGENRGPKVDVFKYKNKSGSRRRQGHRQTYSTLQVTGISTGAKKKKKASKGSSDDDAKAGSPKGDAKAEKDQEA